MKERPRSAIANSDADAIRWVGTSAAGAREPIKLVLDISGLSFEENVKSGEAYPEAGETPVALARLNEGRVDEFFSIRF